jgi:hypothetical protein
MSKMMEWMPLANLAFAMFSLTRANDAYRSAMETRREVEYHKLEPLRAEYNSALKEVYGLLPEARKIDLTRTPIEVSTSFARLTRESVTSKDQLFQLAKTGREYLNGVYDTRTFDADVPGKYPHFKEAKQAFAVYAGVNYQLTHPWKRDDADWRAICRNAGWPSFLEMFTGVFGGYTGEIDDCDDE